MKLSPPLLDKYDRGGGAFSTAMARTVRIVMPVGTENVSLDRLRPTLLIMKSCHFQTPEMGCDIVGFPPQTRLAGVLSGLSARGVRGTMSLGTKWYHYTIGISRHVLPCYFMMIPCPSHPEDEVASSTTQIHSDIYYMPYWPVTHGWRYLSGPELFNSNTCNNTGFRVEAHKYCVKNVLVQSRGLDRVALPVSWPSH